MNTTTVRWLRGRRSGGPGVVGWGVYQPSVLDTCIYGRYTCSSLHILAMLSSSRTSSLASPFDLAIVRARTVQPGLITQTWDLFDWYSHARYYFYTCGIISLPGDKGRGYITATVRCVLVDEVRASISSEAASNFLFVLLMLFVLYLIRSFRFCI